MRKAMLVLLISMVVVFSACELDTFEIEPKGSLKLTFGALQSRSWEPSISMDVDSYSISGTGPGGRSFIQESNEESTVITDLYHGLWDIRVVAKNGTGEAIGEGFGSVEIQPNRLQTKVIEVQEFSGTGSLNLFISWPLESADNPMISVSIVRVGSGTRIIDEVFTAETTGTFSRNFTNLAAGYYEVAVGFLDGLNRKKFGTIQSVRIVQGQTTQGTLALTNRDLDVVGDLELTVHSFIKQSFGVSLSPESIAISEGTTQLFTASASTPGNLYYAWYIDGEFVISGTDTTFSVPHNLALGSHTVDVIASLSGVSASASADVQVEEAAYIDVELTRLSGTGPDSLRYRFEGGFLGDISSILPGSTVIARGDPFALRVDTQSRDVDLFAIGGFDRPVEYENDFYEISNEIMINLPFSMLSDIPAQVVHQENADYVINALHIGISVEDDLGNSYSVYLPEDSSPLIYTARLDTEAPVGSFLHGSMTISSSPLYLESESSSTMVGTYSIGIDFKISYLAYKRIFQISYNGNGATYGQGPRFSIAGLGEVTSADNIPFDFPNQPSYYFRKDNSHFTSWNTEPDGSGITYYAGALMVPEPTQDRILYAQWISPYSPIVRDSGYIFYENPNYLQDGWRYLEAARDWQGGSEIASWSNSSESPVGTSIELGRGDDNSVAIVQTSGTTETFAEFALNYMGGSAGWYLPSVEESIRAMLALQSNFPNIQIISSTECSDSTFYRVQMTYGGVIGVNTCEKANYSNTHGNYLPVRKLDTDMNPIPVNW